MMQLDDYRIPGHNMIVKGNLELRTEDIAGETSGTDSIEKGIKPKILRISLTIPFKSPKDLTGLIKVAETQNEAGERKIYTIVHRTATTAGIRQVRFFDHFNWNDNDTLMQWEISFALQEYLSNPERAENRTTGLVSAVDISQHSQILESAENYFI